MNLSVGANAQVEASTHPAYRADIDGLRAVAVLSVIGFHVWPRFVPGGFVGVDVFFGISGFLISTIIFKACDRGVFSFREFYMRRVRRIFPALLVVLVACYLGGWFIFLAPDFKQLGLHIGAGAGFVSNFLLWHEVGYFDQAAEAKPLLHLWSLGIEEQFYIFWPPLLYFAYKKKLNRLSIVVLVCVVSFAICAGRVTPGREALFYSPLSRIWELAIGSVVAYLALHPSAALKTLAGRVDAGLAAVIYSAPVPVGKALRNVTSLAGVALVVTAVFLLDKTRLYPGWWALLPTVGAVLLIAAGPGALPNRTLLSNGLMRGIGLISFPLYLWHWPLLSFATKYTAGSLTNQWRVGVVALSFVLATAVYVLVEKPLRSGGKLTAKAAVLAALMVLVGGLGLFTYAKNGFAFRWSAYLNISGLPPADYRSLLRIRTCQLEFTDQNETAFGDCTHRASSPGAGSIIVWGDSLASSLYPGIVDRYGKNYNVTQLTMGACPPLLNYANENCGRVAAYVLDRAIKEKTSRVMLSAMWGHYGRTGVNFGTDWKQVGAVIAKLKAGGVTKIDLIGPFPQWRATMTDLLLAAAREDKVNHAVPTRIASGLEPDLTNLDREMRAFAASAGVNYVSPFEIMCNEFGCLTMLGHDADSLTSFDYVHLTPMAATYMAARFPD
jgi:peptidoglycan/LPS O-acetylase OafA/YrhL